jgi:hypothetical protein
MISKDLLSYNVKVEETDLFISSEKDLSKITYESVLKYREILKNYKNEEFFKSFSPIAVEEGSHDMIKHMSEVSFVSNTGPMASVAGAISYYVGIELMKHSNEIIIENGGDIFIKSNHNRKIKIFAGNSIFSNKLSIEIQAKDTPIGICTSSGTVGHSFSYGKADAVVVVSKDVVLADGVATSAANLVKSENDVDKCIDYIKNIENIMGVVVIINKKLGVWGNLKII